MVAYSMIASWLAFSMGSSPVILPSDITMMRSLMRRISGSSEEIMMIDFPSRVSSFIKV